MTTEERLVKTEEELHNYIQEVATLRVELRRIKDGIKRRDGVMIVDGNDMCDWGWMTHEAHNSRLRKALDSKT